MKCFLLSLIDTFWTNPQYRVEVTDADENDDEDLGTIIVALLQKERRKKKSEGIDFLTMGYSLYKVERASYVVEAPLYEVCFILDVTTVTSYAWRLINAYFIIILSLSNKANSFFDSRLCQPG